MPTRATEIPGVERVNWMARCASVERPGSAQFRVRAYNTGNGLASNTIDCLVEDNAGRIRARLVTEGANAAVTPEADQVLQERGIFLVPDIIANAGGVIVSYFEWVQDLQAFFWEEEEINTKLHHVITRAFYEILHTSVNKRVDMRAAAYALAVQRVANATTVRGIYP